MAPQADLALPVRLQARRHRIGTFEGEFALMAAVLADAVRVYLRGPGKANPYQRREFYEVREWLFAKSGDGPFAYVNLCEALAIDSGWLRRSLTRLRLEGVRWMRKDELGSRAEPTTPSGNRGQARSTRPQQAA
jgi:hypothetical protein